MIEINNIKKTFNGQVVVDIDKLLLEEEKFYALIGTNGSGKSTFARILSGIIKPDNEIQSQIFRKNDSDGKKENIVIGYLPQKAYMFDMKLEYNIKIGYNKENVKNKAFDSESFFKKTGKKYVERKVNEMITKFGLESLRKKNAKKFSGGEQQKVALARFMMQDFDFIILDEPTSAMDEKSEFIAEEIIKEYAKNKTLILITHEIEQAKRFTESRLLMNNGKIIQQHILI